MKLAFGACVARRIEAGDQGAMLTGLVAMAALWFDLAGGHLAIRNSLGAVSCVADASPVQGALLAAAKDLCAVLELSPQGRKALADFGGKPFLEQAKGE